MSVDLTRKVAILYISSVDISQPNGPGVNEREFVVSLSEKLTNRVSFILPKPENIFDWIPFKCFYYPVISRGLFKNTIFQIVSTSFMQIIKYLKATRKSKIDLVVFRLNYPSLFCVLCMRLIKQNYVIKTLGSTGINVKKPSSSTISFITRKILSLLFDMSIQGSLAIDVCTDQYFKYYSKKLPEEKLLKVENSVNIKRFYPKNKKEIKLKLGLAQFNKIVGYVGGSPSKRGAKQLVEISPKLKEQHLKWGIVIVGDDSQTHILKKRAKQLGTENLFVWAGVVPYEKVVDYISCFDVGIALDTTERLEKIGNSSQKIRQYLACGVPVICGKGTNRFIEEENLGFLVDSQNTEEIFQAVNTFIFYKEQEANNFSKKAVKYAYKNLSTDIAIKTRLKFWGKQLQQFS